MIRPVLEHKVRRTSTALRAIALLLIGCTLQCGRFGFQSPRDQGRYDQTAGHDQTTDVDQVQPTPSWSSLGGSSFGPASTFLIWGSATGGGISNNTGSSRTPAVTVDPSGAPWIAWSDETPGNYEVYLKRFDGTSWVEASPGSASGGGISNNLGTSWIGSPVPVFDAAKLPIMAWHDDTSGNNEIYVRRFNGSSWVEAGAGSASGGGISNNPGESLCSNLGVDASGRLLAAWRDDTSGNRQIYVRRYDGSAWTELGAGAATGSGMSKETGWADYTKVFFNGSGQPVLVWPASSSAGWKIHQRHFDGTAWIVDLDDTSGTVSNLDRDLSIVLDASHRPIVAWDGGSAPQEIYVRRFDGTAWVELGAGSGAGGGISSTAGDSLYPNLELDASGAPMVAWSDNTSGNWEVYVRRWSGTSWVEMGAGSASGGGISNNAGDSLYPGVVIDGSGAPLIVWRDDTSGNIEIYVRRWSGTSWVEMGPGNAAGGGISSNAGSSVSAALTLDAAGGAVVAWQDRTAGNDEIYLRRFDGASWVEMGAGSASGGGVSKNTGASTAPALVLDGTGKPTVAWQDESSGKSEIYLRRFDGTSWVEVGTASASGGGISKNAGASTAPALIVDGAGNPVVAWQDDSSGKSQIYLRRFDGTSWVEVGAGSASGGGVSKNVSGGAVAPALAADGTGKPVVAWQDDASSKGKIYARRFDGNSWVEVGAGSASGGGVSGNAAGGAAAPALVIDGAGLPVVAWQDVTAGKSEVYLRRFDGTSWIELGTASASAGGISKNAGASVAPALAIDGASLPVVAWQDDTAGNAEIYVRRFDGAAWREVGAGSASGGGVSHSGAGSYSPSIAIRGNRCCVAWHEGGQTSREVVMRCADL